MGGKKAEPPTQEASCLDSRTGGGARQGGSEREGGPGTVGEVMETVADNGDHQNATTNRHAARREAPGATNTEVAVGRKGDAGRCKWGGLHAQSRRKGSFTGDDGDDILPKKDRHRGRRGLFGLKLAKNAQEKEGVDADRHQTTDKGDPEHQKNGDSTESIAILTCVKGGC